MRSFRPLLTSLVLLAVLVTAHLPATSAAVPVRQYASVRIMAEWEGEAERQDFQQLLLPFFQQQSITVDLVNSTDLAETLERDIAEGNPPDAVLMSQTALLEEYARAGALVPLDDVLGGPAPGYLPAIADALTVDGTGYGRFVRLSVDSLVWYSPASLQAVGALPATWDDLLAVSAAISADGTPAWALGLESGDAGTDAVEAILLQTAGPSVIEGLVDGSVAWTDPAVRAAWEQFGTLLDTGIVPNASQLSPVDAARAPLASPPEAHFALGPSTALRWTTGGTRLQPASDVDFFPMPGNNAGSVSISGDFLVLFNDDTVTLQLAQLLVMPETAAAWAALGSAVSPYPDASYPDAVMERAAALVHTGQPVLDLSNRLPVAVQDAFKRGVLDYVGDRATLDSTLSSIQAAAEEAS